MSLCYIGKAFGAIQCTKPCYANCKGFLRLLRPNLKSEKKASCLQLKCNTCDVTATKLLFPKTHCPKHDDWII